MARELALEGDAVDHAEREGFVARKTVYAGRRGCRDHDFYGYGHTILVEFKRRGRPLDPHQERERKRLAEVGVKVHVIDNFDDFAALIAKAKANPIRSML